MRIQRRIRMSGFQAKDVGVEIRNKVSLEVGETHLPQSNPQSELFQVVYHVEFLVEPI